MKLKKNIAISESGFIFNPEIGTSFTTNSLGVAILKQLKTKTSNKEIIDSVVKNYEIDAITCEKDLDDFLRILNQFNLIEE
ncbi:MAG: PqqD family peptide modification chaperone [Flavobacteriaceae bacterium]|nr:PqqD family peptide modification chaperone [Flavobacteriaceae bacterium]